MLLVVNRLDNFGGESPMAVKHPVPFKNACPFLNHNHVAMKCIQTHLKIINFIKWYTQIYHGLIMPILYWIKWLPNRLCILQLQGLWWGCEIGRSHFKTGRVVNLVGTVILILYIVYLTLNSNNTTVGNFME